MSRYIDLDSNECVWCGNPGEYENWNVPLDMPGEDVAPVVHAHWHHSFGGFVGFSRPCVCRICWKRSQSNCLCCGIGVTE